MLKPRSVLIVIMHPVPIKIWGNFEEIWNWFSGPSTLLFAAPECVLTPDPENVVILYFWCHQLAFAFPNITISNLPHTSSCQLSWKVLGSLTLSWLRGKICYPLRLRLPLRHHHHCPFSRLDPEYGYKMSNVTFKFENSPEVGFSNRKCFLRHPRWSIWSRRRSANGLATTLRLVLNRQMCIHCNYDF